ncbi:MAG: hypothetical protein Q9185_005934 [Variospora sp. 1 TL-2023]
MSTIDDIIGFLATFDNRLKVIENAMTVHHDHRATVQSILTGHGLSKIRLPIRDQPLPSLRYLGLNFDLAVVANTGAIPAAGPPGARPYHLTSTVVDVLFLSVQELAMRIDLLAGQVNGIVSRSDRLDWRLDRLAVQLDRLQATQQHPGDDQTRVSRAKTVERTQFSGESLAALREKLRLEMQSMRAEQDDDIVPAPMPTSLPPKPSATAPAAAPPARKTPTPPAATRSQTPSPPPRPDSPNLIFMSPPTPHPHPTRSIPPSKTIPAPSPSPHLNPLAPAFNPSSLVLPETSFNPTPKAPITPPPPPPPKEEGKDLSPEIPIPRSQVAAALTNAFAIATRGMRFQTLAESRFAPKSTTSSTTSPKKNLARPASAFTKPTFASSITPTITTTFAGNSSIPTSQDEEEEAATAHAQIFKERFRGRGIAVGATTTTDNGKGISKGKGREIDEERVVGGKRGGTAVPAAKAKHDGGLGMKKNEKDEEEEEGGVYASLALFEDVVNHHNSGGGGGSVIALEEVVVVGQKKEKKKEMGKGK